MDKFWKFIKNEATETSSEGVELRIDGTIMDDEDAWIYEWLGIPCTSPNAFRNELSQYTGKDITVWINSCGGNVFAAAGMYNALMEHKNTGGKIITKVDSKAMSAATIPYMAGDERLMSPLAIFMIHNPLTEASGYASDFRKIADVLDTVKETIINAYELATGLSRDKISSLMDGETYMDANTAINDGFADGILYQKSADESKNVMNFAFSRISIQNCANESFKHLLEIENKIQKKTAYKNIQKCQCSECSQTQDDCRCADCGICPNCCSDKSCCGCNCQNNDQCNKSTVSNCKNKTINMGGKNMEIKNVEELKTQLPEIHKTVYNSGNSDGVIAERERLKAFDVLNGKVDAAFLNEEKYKDGATAENVLFKAMQEGKVINTSYIDQAAIDAANANKVPGDISDKNSTDEVTGILNFVANTAKKAIGNGGK